ncbi:hypothetical protein H920_15554 [Fukomys damarensis]|uniref:Uncharacterized protein n=1 Tax=Fukomys damarensis TaxID=885580 RepID=A0A091CU72_FUKDA|nr:hypothetical protein H920_15554 [Fukomys damarensis]
MPSPSAAPEVPTSEILKHEHNDHPDLSHDSIWFLTTPNQKRLKLHQTIIHSRPWVTPDICWVKQLTDSDQTREGSQREEKEKANRRWKIMPISVACPASLPYPSSSSQQQRDDARPGLKQNLLGPIQWDWVAMPSPACSTTSSSKEGSLTGAPETKPPPQNS